MNEEMIIIPKTLYEMERKMRFFGIDSNEKYHSNSNIFIGISISNKKLTPKMAENYLKWALANTKDKVCIVIADKLNIVNYEIFDGYGETKAKNRAEKVGEEFANMFRNAIEKLKAKEKEKISIYKWSEVSKSKEYLEVYRILCDEYKKDIEFQNAVLYFIKKYMRKKGKIIQDKSKIDRLASYILGELPTLLEGIEVNKEIYDLCIYPTYFASGMSQFVMDIHSEELDIGKILKNKLKRKAILVEAWLD